MQSTRPHTRNLPLKPGPSGTPAPPDPCPAWPLLSLWEHLFCPVAYLGVCWCVWPQARCFGSLGPPPLARPGEHLAAGVRTQLPSVQRHSPAPGTEHTVGKCPSSHSLACPVFKQVSVCTWPGLHKRVFGLRLWSQKN